MEKDDKKFEEYLGEFEPRRPRALPALVASKPVWPRRLAAAVVAVTLGSSVWFLRQKGARQEGENVVSNQSSAPAKQAPRHALSIIVLTRLAVDNPSGLDAALAAAQENRLPRFDREGSALRILAKE